MIATLPRVEISLPGIRHNARILSAYFEKEDISLMGVSKAVLGDPRIVDAMIQGGVRFIADSRIENIRRAKTAGIKAQFVLLRTPMSRADEVVDCADYSLNTEVNTIEKLSHCAARKNIIHKIILMVEMGDLREGIAPEDLLAFIDKVRTFPGTRIAGIGCNLACHGGVLPNERNMRLMSDLASSIEQEFRTRLEIVSGGNSANYNWYKTTQGPGKINNLRLGEAILLGCETATRTPIPGLDTKCFELIAEVIELKRKPSIPLGETGQDAFGNFPAFEDRGVTPRAIVALGRQDVDAGGLTSVDNLPVLGASSDHLILDAGTRRLKVGDEVKFNLKYSALLAAMTSPFIKKVYTQGW